MLLRDIFFKDWRNHGRFKRGIVHHELIYIRNYIRDLSSEEEKCFLRVKVKEIGSLEWVIDYDNYILGVFELSS